MVRTSRFLAAAAVAVFALSVGSVLAAGQAGGQKKPEASLMGTLQKVDGQTLTVQTTRGPQTVMLQPSAQIRSGAKTLTSADLSSQVGSRVRVSYVMNGATKTAERVVVSGNSAATATGNTAKK